MMVCLHLWVRDTGASGPLRQRQLCGPKFSCTPVCAVYTQSFSRLSLRRLGLALRAMMASSFPRLPSYSPTQISSLIRPCMFQLTLASDLDQVESNPKRLFISCFDLFLGHGAGWTREFCLVSAHCTSCKQAKVVPGQSGGFQGGKRASKKTLWVKLSKPSCFRRVV